MNRIAAVLLAGIMLIGLCAAAVAEEWTFERGITIVCTGGWAGARTAPSAP